MWWLLNMIAYNSFSLGPFPLVVLIGFVALFLFLVSVVLIGIKRKGKHLQKLPLGVHRWIGITAIILAIIHLVMALTAYIGVA